MKRIIALTLVLCLTAALFCGCRNTAGSEPVTFDIRDDAYNLYYEIFVGSFYDSNGDGCGDLQGIIEKIDYLNDGDYASETSLHVGGVWLMPIMPSPTYHKYDITDYYDVDPDYGTLDDFRQLADAFSERGIELIIDMPVNHSSNYHPWFISACQSIGIEPCGGGDECLSGDVLCSEHNIYCQYYNFSQERPQGYHPVKNADGWYYEAQFGTHMPDLNLDSQPVRDEIVSICKFWLDMGIAGFRLDTITNYYTNSINASGEFLGWFYDELKACKDDVYLVGEVWKSDIEIKSYYEASHIPSLFNFPFSSTGTINKAVRNGSGAVLSERLISWNQMLSTYGCIDAPFLSNHDQTRSSGAFPGNESKKQAAAVYMLMPGNPFIYYGEEIAMGGGGDNDPHKRAPMVWSLTDTTGQCDPPEGTTKVREVDAGVAEQLGDPDSLLRFYIAVSQIRNQWAALARGEVSESVYSSDDESMKPLCAYTVSYEGTTLTVLHNLGEEPITLTLTEGDRVVNTLAAGGTQPTVEKGILTMPWYTTVILLSETAE